MRIIKYLGLTVVCLLVAAVLILGYLGFIPGIANIFGSSIPTDLGVTYSDADLQSVHKKTGVKLSTITNTSSPTDSIVFSGTKKLTSTFTSAELTALINAETWKYHPVKNAQVKISADGTIEFSAVLLKDRIAPYTESMGGSAKDVGSATKYLVGDPPIYVKGKALMENNTFTFFDIIDAKIGRLDITTYLKDSYTSQAMSYIEDRVAYVPGLHVESAKIVDNLFSFAGSIYASKAVAE